MCSFIEFVLLIRVMCDGCELFLYLFYVDVLMVVVYCVMVCGGIVWWLIVILVVVFVMLVCGMMWYCVVSDWLVKFGVLYSVCGVIYIFVVDFGYDVLGYVGWYGWESGKMILLGEKF